MKLPHLLSTTGCLLSPLVASSAFAHEGHGEHRDAVDGALHWFTHLDHLAAIAGLVLAVAFVVKFIGRRRAVRIIQKTDR